MAKKCSVILKFLIVLSLTAYVSTFAVKFTLNFTPLYSFDIDYLKLEQSSNLSKNSMKENYKAVIDYINNKDIKELHLPSLDMSEAGSVHFYEVKKIFELLTIINIFSAFISLLLIGIFFYFKDFSFLKECSISLVSLPILLFTPFLINFDKSFTFFHKLLFNNSYWEFDPVTDPIINILPEDFFFHCILLIVCIMFLFSLIFAVIFILIKKRRD